MTLYHGCGYVSYGGNLPVPCPQCRQVGMWMSRPHGPVLAVVPGVAPPVPAPSADPPPDFDD